MSHSFIRNCCCITASFTSSRMKDFCQKWKVKLIFQGAYRLSGTGIVERLEITDVGCNLKVWWLDLTDPDPEILQQIYATASRQRGKASSNWLYTRQSSSALQLPIKIPSCAVLEIERRYQYGPNSAATAVAALETRRALLDFCLGMAEYARRSLTDRVYSIVAVGVIVVVIGMSPADWHFSNYRQPTAGRAGPGQAGHCGCRTTKN